MLGLRKLRIVYFCPTLERCDELREKAAAMGILDTQRLHLIKIAARVVEMKTQIHMHLPTSCPDQAILRIVLDRIPRLVT
jgi:hypothetical protein